MGSGGRFFFLVVTLVAVVAGCSASEPMGVDGGAADAAQVLEGAPEIVLFTADPNPVAAGNTTQLSWRVKNVRSVEISGPAGTLVSTFEAAGVVETQALTRTSTFTLVARGEGPAATTSVVVGLLPAALVIEDFSASSPQVLRATPVSIRWSVVGAETVRFFADGELVAEHPGNRYARVTGTETFVTTLPVHSFVLEAVTPQDTQSRSLEISTVAQPRIERFVVRPRVLFEPTITSTVEWSAMDSSSVALFENEVFVEDFPGGLSGTLTKLFDRQTTLRLMLIDSRSDVSSFAIVGPPILEKEPNDDVSVPVDFSTSGGLIGEISRPSDVDVCFYQNAATHRFRVSTHGDRGHGCQTDTAIRVMSTDGTLIAADADGGDPLPNGGACAVLVVDIGERSFMGAPFLIEVRGERGDTGPYTLLVEDL